MWLAVNVYFIFLLLFLKFVKDVIGGADFAKAETLEKIHKFILYMDKDLLQTLCM